jgi:hypothetical protein
MSWLACRLIWDLFALPSRAHVIATIRVRSLKIQPLTLCFCSQSAPLARATVLTPKTLFPTVRSRPRHRWAFARQRFWSRPVVLRRLFFAGSASASQTLRVEKSGICRPIGLKQIVAFLERWLCQQINPDCRRGPTLHPRVPPAVGGEPGDPGSKKAEPCAPRRSRAATKSPGRPLPRPGSAGEGTGGKAGSPR